MLSVDYGALVSRADLVYQSPVAIPVEGQPIGNGRMGTLVWTTPGALHFQINRNDVFAVNKHHAGPYGDAADYCGACAQVTVEVGGTPFAGGAGFVQRLSLYEAECTLAGAGVALRCLVAADCDALLLELADRRADPQPLRVTLSMWRPPEVRTGQAHLATYTFAERGEQLLLTQQFREGDHYCASAVALGASASDARVEVHDAYVEYLDARSRVLCLPAAPGPRMVVVTSAAAWSPDHAVGAEALATLQAALRQPYAALRERHARWWAGFWERTYVHLHSEDGLADFMACVRTLHLYYMASTSRGLFPPKWNGSLFTTDGDMRAWGSQFWVWTTEMHYFPLLAADAADLCEPFSRMAARQLPACQIAAQQRWDVPGAFYPETTPFDGPVALPPDAAAEYRAVFLGQQPARTLSARTRALCGFEHHLACILYPLQDPPAVTTRFSWISHLASSACELAVQAWWRYRHTGDEAWLCEIAYPLLREATEFYRHLSRREEDGLYHLHGLNQHEDFWGVKDGIWDLAAVRGAAPLALRAAEILGQDEALRAAWRAWLDDLAPYPLGGAPRAQALTGGVLAEDVWAAGLLDEVDGQHNPEDVWLTPVFPFEDWTLESRDPAVDGIVRKLVDLAPRLQAILGGATCNTTIRTPIAVARAGRGEALPAILAAYYAAFGPLANGWGLFEGHGKWENQAHSIEALGCISTVLQEGLLQSVAPRPGQPEVISVFPAWPRAWEASFCLLARGGFRVSSAQRGGAIEFVELTSRLGETCRLRNPWGSPCQVSTEGGDTQEMEGDLLCWATVPGGRYRVAPRGAPPAPDRRIAARPATGPTTYAFTLPHGTVARGILGRAR